MKKPWLPIIILSALESEIKQAMAYEFGACQYVTKPCNPDLLLSQVKRTISFAQRKDSIKTRYTHFYQWTLDSYERVLFDKNNVSIELSRMEYDLLSLFTSNAGQPITHDMITQTLYNRNYDVFDRSIDNLIGRVRKKLRMTQNILK